MIAPAAALAEGSKAAIIEGNPGADNATQRRLGHEDSVAAHKLALRDSRTAHREIEEADQVFSTMPTAHPDLQGGQGFPGRRRGQGAAERGPHRHSAGRLRRDPAMPAMIADGGMLASVDQFGQQMAATANRTQNDRFNVA